MQSNRYQFVIVIYPSEDDEGKRYTAHCLNMDIVAEDDCIEGSVSNLLENIEATVEAARKHNANAFRDAPKEYWKKLEKAVRLSPELVERIVFNANKRLGADSRHHIVDLEKNCDLRQLETV